MKTNKEKFLELVSGKDTGFAEDIQYRHENKSAIRESKRIAIKILLALKQNEMTQKNLAEKMGVSAQYISKLVKGEENLTLDTIVKLQDILNISILASHKKEEASVPMHKINTNADEFVTFNDSFNLFKKKA